MLKEWPLVAFTILGQMAVGIFLLFHANLLDSTDIRAVGWRTTWRIELTVVIVLVVLASLISFFHLRHLFRARHVLANLRSSWLSREILFELGFLALVVLTAALAWGRVPGHAPVTGLLVAASLAGLLFLISMTKLYMLSTLPAWRMSSPSVLFPDDVQLGAIATEIIVYSGGVQGVFGPSLLANASVFVLLEILLTIFIAPRHGIRGIRSGPSLRPDRRYPRLLHWGRIAFLSLGFLFIVMATWTGTLDPMAARGPSPALILAFVFVLAGEVVGRFQFYGLVSRPGD
jgi:anaerobic dimethyl sulfoxide reductase subunit C (anchor subunit)